MSGPSNVREAVNRRVLDMIEPEMDQSGRALMREYSGIPDEEIDSHVNAISVKALAVRPYPCLRILRFMDLSMVKSDIYPEVLQRVKNGDKFLDLACCLGQEIRKLVFDGAPSANTYGTDLWGGFFPVGYELFKDEGTLQTKFVAADIFADSSPLDELAGQMNIVYVGDFFHLFNLEDQEKAAAKIVPLLVPKPGSLIIGRQTGSDAPGEYSRSGDTSGRTHFRHSPESWQEVWSRVGEKTGSRWSVKGELVASEFTVSAPDGKSSGLQSQGLRYTIARL